MPENHVKARELFKQAADLGDIKAQYCLAGMFCQGLGGENDYHQAVHYATLACRRKDASSALRMGDLHHLGVGGLPQSLFLAKHYLKKAAENGNECAYFPLAQTLINLNDEMYHITLC